MDDISQRMDKSIQNLKKNLSGVRTGRANTELVDSIVVEYYGSRVPLNQVASITVPESMMIVLNVFDQNAVTEVEKAIMKSDLGLTPQTEGTVIRLNLPMLTEERRLELVKVVKKESEECKVAIRNIRRDAVDYFKNQLKEKEISEDDLKSQTDSIQSVTDEFISKIDTISKQKETEITTI